MNLPHGTVTFFMTDIEGSTRHWDMAPEAMRQALRRHDLLAAAIISRHGGLLVKNRGEGDSLFAVFAHAAAALQAALAFQIALADESWPTPSHVRVRIALHTGDADLRDGDYYGPAVNRCARLRGLARGGQILLSDSTRACVHHTLPPGAKLNDLGIHRLKDLQEPEQVYDVAYPGLSATPAVTPPPHNLPRQLTSFVGRERQIDDVKRLLHGACLLTLTGSGGVGKTRLAQRAADEVLNDYPNGVWIAELATVTDPSLLPQTIANALKVREEAGRPLMATLIDHLQGKAILLLLDNCEHLLAAAHLVEDLLRNCPNLRVLATSREPFNIGGETVYRVPSLSLPDPRASLDMDHVARFEAVRLFVERATAAAPDFALTNHNGVTVAGLCRQLDGIPLAIELAAVRVKSMPVEQINHRLADRFQFLTGGSRTAPTRQQTLRALIDWSYDLLTDAERELFHRLSVFAGGFTLEAVEFVCAADRDLTTEAQASERRLPLPREERHKGRTGEEQEREAILPHPSSFILHPSDVLALLTSLVDKSLLHAESEDGRARYRLMETLRQYAREKLQASGWMEAMQCRHMDYYLDIVEDAERKLRGSEQAWWLERLDTEHDNLRAALAWSPPEEADKRKGLHLAASLWWFWHVRGYFTEGREWLAAKLEIGSERTPERARALNGAAVLARNQCDYAAARTLSLESLDIKRELGDRQGIAASLNNLATLALAQSDFNSAAPFYEESLAIERKLGNRQGVTSCLIGLGNVAMEQGRYAEAEMLYRETLTLKRELGDRRGIATALIGLGNIDLYCGNYRVARRPIEESLDIRRSLRDRRGTATSLAALGLLALAEGELHEAELFLKESLAIRGELRDKLGIAGVLHSQAVLAIRYDRRSECNRLNIESLTICDELGNRRGVAYTLELAANLAARDDYPERAARMIGAADALRKAIGSPLHEFEKPDHVNTAAVSIRALGEEAFLAERGAGRMLSTEEAVRFASEDLIRRIR